MIRQLTSKGIIDYIKNNPKSVLLDVRTQREWNQIGIPDGDKIGLKTYFLSLLFEVEIINENFLQEFKNLNIDKNFQILTICATGGRSQMAAEILTKEGYNCLNVSDGFSGNNDEKIGWKNNQLPIK